MTLHLAYWERTTIGVVALLIVVPALTLLVGHAVFRVIGPRSRRAGGADDAGPGGSLQLLADLTKAVQKEDVLAPGGDRVLMDAALAVGVGAPFVVAALVPIGPRVVMARPDAGVLIAVVAWVIGALAAATGAVASSDAAATLGSLAAVRRIVAASFGLLVVVASVGVQAETLSLQGIVAAQAQGRLFGWSGIAEPYVLPQAAGFAVAVIALTAVTGHGPFDEPQPLSPYRVWSGLRLVLWRSARLATLLAGSAVIASVYLGGWAWPGHTSGVVLDATGPVLLAAKTLLVAAVILVAGITLPRTDDDRFVAMAWRWLVPLALAQLVITACLKVAL